MSDQPDELLRNMLNAGMRKQDALSFSYDETHQSVVLLVTRHTWDTLLSYPHYGPMSGYVDIDQNDVRTLRVAGWTVLLVRDLQQPFSVVTMDSREAEQNGGRR